MEERKSWLPAGLESSGWQPDDRASQRSGSGSKRSGGAADASGAGKPSAETSSDAAPSASSSPWQPYDPKRPESKRSRKSTESEPAVEQKETGSKADREQTQPKAEQPREPEGERDNPEDADEKDGDSDGHQGGRSDVDAMGQDKHRQVIGQRVGASRAKQLAYYGAFVAFVIAAYLGLKVAVSHFDKAPAHDTNQAPWSKPGAPDEPLGGFTPKTNGEKGPTNFQ